MPTRFRAAFGTDSIALLMTAIVLVILAAVSHNFPTPSETVLQQARDNQQLMEWRVTGPGCCQAFKFEGGPSCKTYRPGSDRSGVMAFS